MSKFMRDHLQQIDFTKFDFVRNSDCQNVQILTIRTFLGMLPSTPSSTQEMEATTSSKAPIIGSSPKTP